MSLPLAGGDFVGSGDGMYELAERLYPICRSITGDGVRQTLRVLSESIPVQVREVPSGTKVFDWEVPREWNIQDAYVADASGKRWVDFGACNLHVLNYSCPIRKQMSWSELQPHLFTLPDTPDWVPYRTTYYTENWGFCLSHAVWEQMAKRGEDQLYDVCIDASLTDGSLTYGEVLVEGESEDEILVSCHICHPSLCNDNLSGIAVATRLASYIADRAPRYSYRFLFIPGTIGSITWLALNEVEASRIRHGLVITCVGDEGSPTYKRSRRGTADIDRSVCHVLAQSKEAFSVEDFIPYGYDERQYCSPGFDLPVGCFMRTPNGRYPEYHTSADNLQLIRPKNLEDSLVKLYSVFYILEQDRRFVSQNQRCEPQLGKRGLYSAIGGIGGPQAIDQMDFLWVLNLSDGEHSLLDIAERSGTSFERLKRAADILQKSGLLVGS